MKRVLFTVLVAVVLVLSLGLAGQPVAASNADDNGLGRYIVVFDLGVNDAAKDDLVKQFGGVVEKPIALLGNANVVFLPPRAVGGFAQRAEILRLEEDTIVTTLRRPQPAPPPPETLPWGVDQIDADLAWSVSRGAGVKVAIIDTGIDQDHPDLVANIKGGRNFVAIRGRIDPNKWDDDNGHGTHVAGIVAAVDNDIGVIGVAPEAWLYGVKVLSKSGLGYISDVILGIEWAINNNMRVINMSLGTSSDVQSLHDAVDTASLAGIVLVAAAGNSGDTDPDNDIGYPARYSSVIAVAAADNNNIRASWSSDGPEVELAAPGVSIYSTYKGGGFTTLSGTSMASPHVAGSVALVIASGITDTNGNGFISDEVRTKLQTTADDLPPTGVDNYTGYGLVDAGEAVTGTP